MRRGSLESPVRTEPLPTWSYQPKFFRFSVLAVGQVQHLVAWRGISTGNPNGAVRAEVPSDHNDPGASTGVDCPIRVTEFARCLLRPIPLLFSRGGTTGA